MLRPNRAFVPGRQLYTLVWHCLCMPDRISNSYKRNQMFFAYSHVFRYGILEANNLK